MQREKANFDILERIKSERIRRNWTEYTMARNAGLTQSTISTWYRKKLQPSVASLEKICTAFGISLSEFFSDEAETSSVIIEKKPSAEGNRFVPTIPQDKLTLLSLWGCLSPAQRKAVLLLLESIINENQA